MAAKKPTITLGLSEIRVGDAAPNGVMPTSLEKIGRTYKDTCKLTQEAGEVTEHFEENNPAPIIRFVEKKIPKLVFSIMDADVDALAAYVGGKVVETGSDPNKVRTWQFDGTEKVAPRSIQVRTKQGLYIDIPNGSIEAHINAEFSAKGIFLVEFEVTPLSVDKNGAIRAYVPKA